MFARILGTTALALALAGPAAAAGEPDPTLSPGQRHSDDLGAQAEEAMDPNTGTQASADPRGVEGLNDRNVAPQSMNPRGLYPTARPDAGELGAKEAREPEVDEQIGTAPIAPQSMDPRGLYPTGEG